MKKLVVATLTFSIVAGCSGEEADSPGNFVYIGGIISLTGSSATPSWGNAMELAISHANRGLASAGYDSSLQFAKEIRDSANQSEQAVEAAVDLVKTRDIKAILNGTSNSSLHLNATAYNSDTSDDLDIPIMCMSCSSPSHHNPKAENEDPALQAAFRNTDGWHFGLSMSSEPQARTLAKIMATAGKNSDGDINEDGKTKISIIAIDDPFGNGFAQVLEASLKELFAMPIIEILTHPKDADLNSTDWGGYITKMIDDLPGDVKPDHILEITFPQYSAALIRAYNTSSSSIPFLHTHSVRENAVRVQVNAELDKHEGTSYLPMDGSSGESFATAFTNAYGAVQSQWDSHTYDATFLVALAVMATSITESKDPSQVSGAEVRDALKLLNNPNGVSIGPGADDFAKAIEAFEAGNTVNYQGASGPCDFDQYGRAVNKLSHWRYENGDFKDVAIYDCVQNMMECPVTTPSNAP